MKQHSHSVDMSSRDLRNSKGGGVQRSPLVVLALMLSALATFGHAAAEDFAYCTVCHGATGNGNIAIRAPKIAGLEPWYVKRQLEAFASGARGGHSEDFAGQEMRTIGVRLGAEGSVDVAVSYVQSLRPQPISPTIDGDLERGKALYSTCASCHGAQAEGNPSLQAPALASRNDWYLVQQLENFRSGSRGSHPQDTYGAQMRAAALTLPDERSARDVVAFINGLK
jgi:cytochrome c oxidase subunit II